MKYSTLVLWLLVLRLTSGCVETMVDVKMDATKPSPVVIPFKFMEGDTAILVPVTLNNSENVTMIFDTGAGIDILSTKLANKLGVKADATITGRRLTNEPMTVAVGKLNEISFGPVSKINWDVATLDYFDELGVKQNIHGIISLKMFEEKPVTIDYVKKQIVFETPETLLQRVEAGRVVDIQFERQTPQTLTTQLDFLVGSETQLAMIDTGSAPTKLPRKFLQAMNLDPKDPSIRRKKIKTIAGFETEALFVRAPSKIAVKQAPELLNGNEEVRFDPTLRMGSIGGEFFMGKAVTFDLAKKRVIIAAGAAGQR